MSQPEAISTGWLTQLVSHDSGAVCRDSCAVSNIVHPHSPAADATAVVSQTIVPRRGRTVKLSCRGTVAILPVALGSGRSHAGAQEESSRIECGRGMTSSGFESERNCGQA